MARSPTPQEIQDLVALQLGRRRVGVDDRLLEDLGAESIDLVNIIAAVEERYEVVIDELEVGDLRTVADLHRCVAHRLSGG